MDDRLAQFLVILAEVCAAARVAELEVEVELDDGDLVRGAPAPPRTARDGDEVDDTGYARELTVGDRVIEIDTVVAVTLHAPR